MNNLVSEVYSKAFFELSMEKDKLGIHRDDILYVDSVLAGNRDLTSLLSNPNVSKSDKKDLIGKIFPNLSQYTLNFLYVLVDKSRFQFFDQIKKMFIRKYNDEKKISEGIVYSTQELDKEEIKELEEVLGKKFNKKVELKNLIDESLIGGISIRLEGKVIDNSIKSRLDNLKRSLKKERR